MSFQIIPSTPADADELSALVNRAYRGESGKVGWTTEADLIDGTRTDAEILQKIIQTPGQMILKYVEEDQILGCVELHAEGRRLYLGMLTVQPNIQGRGIGKELLKASEAEARKYNCSTIFMNVISVRQELIDWYIRHGYHDSGVRKPFHFTDPRFGQPKMKLEFVVLEKNL